jgi:hypothetical protein
VLLPPFYVDALVALGDTEPTTGAFVTKATGFFVGFRTGKVNESGPVYATFLVTAKHVLEGRTSMEIRCNAGASVVPSAVGITGPDDQPMWFTHSQYDIGATSMNVIQLKAAGADVTFIPDELMRSSSEMLELQIGAGDDAFVLGFPLGLAGSTRNYGIARSAMIARLDGDILSEHDGYLVDSAVYPGNSGGPVVLRPTALALRGMTPVVDAHIIGVVSGFLSYHDTAISQQTGRPRIVFEENSGLARVVPMEALRDLIVPVVTAAAAEDTATKSDTGQPDE